MNKNILIFEIIFIVSLFIFASLTSAFVYKNKNDELKDTSIGFSNISDEDLCMIFDSKSNFLDIDFIYNMTSKLSNIIFDEYDEETGEIAKGRFFGSKGEHKAAHIIYENMTNLGLYTYYEQFENLGYSPYNEITHMLEVLDYNCYLNGEPVNCYIAPTWAGLREENGMLNATFNYTDLKIKKLPHNALIFNKTLAEEKSNFLFIAEDILNNPEGSLPIVSLLKPYMNILKFYMLFYITTIFNYNRQTSFWYNWYPNCKGLILYDHDDICHDMVYFNKDLSNRLPIIYVNGTLGKNILNDLDNQEVDYYLKQRYNTSAISYNVIGQLNGTDSSKTVIVSSLYDSWWCQGTADSAIGMSIVLAIAKYYNDNKIVPKYNMKFVAFGAEEYGYRGAIFYDEYHRDEDIIYVIDVNQVGFTQNEPRLTMDIVANKLGFLNDIWEVAQRSNYVERTNNSADILKIWWPLGSIPSNTDPFGRNRRDCNVVGFFKDGGWVLHHRDGIDKNGNRHMEGDVLKYFNWTDTIVTGEMILNITKHLTIESKENYLSNLPSNNLIRLLEEFRIIKD